MALRTPRQDARRLTFSPKPPPSNFSNPMQSPYTPFASRRSPPTRQPATPGDNIHPVATPTPEPSEEAETFVSGGLQNELRAISLRAVSVARQSVDSRMLQEVGSNFVTQIVTELAQQFHRASSLHAAPTIRPATRRHLTSLKLHLQIELHTWTLLQSAWMHPLPRPTDSVTTRLKLSQRDTHKISNIPGVSKLQVAIKWLETNAAASLKASGGPMVNPLDDPAYRWLYTASKFNDQPVSMDFPLRKDEPLDEIERKAEARLAREVFRLVRAGDFPAAQRVCRMAGQPWRAAVLSGGGGASSMSANGRTGSARRTFRTAARALALSKDVSVMPHERAVAGLLAGVLDPVLAVCSTYEDELWARLTNLLDRTVEDALAAVDTIAVGDDILLQTFRECKFAGEGVDGLSSDVLLALRKVLAYLSLGGDLDHVHFIQFLDCLAVLAKCAVEHNVEWACRLAAEVCLFLKYTGCIFLIDGQADADRVRRMALFDEVILCYVAYVVHSDTEGDEKAFTRRSFQDRVGVCAIAANYLCEVDDVRRAVNLYSELMYAALRGDLRQEVVEARRAKVAPQTVEERRVLCLQEAGYCFSSDMLSELTDYTVTEVWRRHFDPGEVDSMGQRRESGRLVGGDDHGEPENHEIIVRSIEFLTFGGFPNFEKALLRTNAAVRSYFLMQKREVARRLITWFPSEVLEQLAEKNECLGNIREFGCWQIYFKAVSCHNDWYMFKTGNRPNAIPDSVRQAALAQPVQKEAKQKLHLYNNQLREYEKNCDELRNVAVRNLHDALLCVEGGWMNENMLDVDIDDIRRQELQAVRQCGIPQLVSLLHHVFQKSGMVAEAVDVASIVAREEFKLYESFRPAEMKSLLKKIAASAAVMAQECVTLNDGTHPFRDTFFEDFNVVVRESARVTFAE